MNRFLLATVALLSAVLFFWLAGGREHSESNFTDLLGKTWKLYTPPSRAFSVLFPTDHPSQEEDALLDPYAGKLVDYEMYMAQVDDGTLYLVNRVVYPPSVELSNDSALFKSFVDDMVSSVPHNTLLFSAPRIVQGQMMVDFVIQGTLGFTVGRVLRVANAVYVLALQSHLDDKREVFAQFADSLRVK